VSRDEVLVDGAWLEARLGDPSVIVLEADERPLMYRLGHVPGAHCLDWRVDLQDPVTRDIPDRDAVRRLWRRVGLGGEETVVLYGDRSNWYACFGFWLFRLYGVRDLRLLDGGRQAWVAEGRPMTQEAPPENVVEQSRAPRIIKRYRATWRDIADTDQPLLDVRTPQEYRGEVLTEPGYPDEVAQRPGHIPGALNVPWEFALDADGRMRSDDELRGSLAERQVSLENGVITYCRIGERSAHTWFVLHELLGTSARNYDGSWTEWGSMIGMPVALGEDPGDPRTRTRLVVR
jgi:thiosulfate/3-mercaptopyruvate sulfurtransferase